MDKPTFKEFVREMYVDNVDERLAEGEPVQQYQVYYTQNLTFLEQAYVEYMESLNDEQ